MHDSMFQETKEYGKNAKKKFDAFNLFPQKQIFLPVHMQMYRDEMYGKCLQQNVSSPSKLPTQTESSEQTESLKQSEHESETAELHTSNEKDYDVVTAQIADDVAISMELKTDKEPMKINVTQNVSDLA